MKLFSLTEVPEGLKAHRKSTITGLAFVNEPFQVDTQEGIFTISPETVDDWEDGYYVAYPADRSKPYAISPSFVRDNYVPVNQEASHDS